MDRNRERTFHPSKTKASRKSRGMIARVSNSRQEKRGQKGLEAAYNSGLMVGWTKGVDGGRSRGGWTGELRGHFRWRLHELPFPLALRPSPSLSTTRTCPPPPPPFLYIYPSSSSLRPSTCVSLSSTNKNPSPSLFSFLFFSFLFFSSHLHPRCGVTKLPRTADASKLSHNGVTCPLLSRALVISYRLRSSLSLPLTTPFVILFYYTRALVQIGWMRKRERERERERWQVLDRASIYNINPRCSWNRVVGATCR